MMQLQDMSLLAGIAVTIMFSAFFSGMEIAFVSSNRMLLEMDKGMNRLSKKAINVFYAHSNNFVSTLLVGNNIALVIYGILIARFLDATVFAPFDAAITVPADTIISTLIVLFTGEFLPKVLAKSNPNGMLTVFSPFALLCYIVLWPVSRFTTMLSHGLLWLLGVKVQHETFDGEFSKVDLDYLVQSSIDNASPEQEIADEVKIFQNALDFSDIKVRDCMIPRTEICSVDETCGMDELKNIFIESGKSKIVVYKEDIDHIIGYIHSSEMFRNPENWTDHVREMPFVPETMPAQKLMKLFMQQKKTLGVVVDEFGGTSGIISLEDLVEEIFGDFEDEHDKRRLVEEKISDTSFKFSGRIEIEYINEKYGLNIPENEEYQTLAGFILYSRGEIPQEGDTFTLLDRLAFTILKQSATRINLVRLDILPQ